MFAVIAKNLLEGATARDSGIQAGFQVLSSGLEATSIYYQFSNESIIVDFFTIFQDVKEAQTTRLVVTENSMSGFRRGTCVAQVPRRKPLMEFSVTTRRVVCASLTSWKMVKKRCIPLSTTTVSSNVSTFSLPFSKTSKRRRRPASL
jgi:hypothetical protein